MGARGLVAPLAQSAPKSQRMRIFLNREHHRKQLEEIYPNLQEKNFCPLLTPPRASLRARSGVVRAPSTSKVGRRRADVAGHLPCPRLHRCGTRSRAASPTIGLHSCEHVAARSAWASSRQRSASELSADARAGTAAAARARLTLRQHPAPAPAPERRCRLLLPLCSASEHADSSREMTGHVHDLQP